MPNANPLDLPLSALIRRAPVSCTPSTPLKTVLEIMDRLAIGSMMVADADGRLLGMFTLKEALSKVALAQPDLTRPIAEFMNTEFPRLSPAAPVYEAALAMARHGLRHLPLVRDGRLVGVVSASNLVLLHGGGERQISARIRVAERDEELRDCALNIRQAVERLLAEGATAEYLTRFYSTMNDLLTQRIIDLEFGGAKAPRHALCWIALGSEGRFEQTLASDQDNALIFAADTDPDAARREWLPRLRAVNEALDRCGFPLCRGEIMASNPHWCLSLDEWNERFAAWIINCDPEALLNASIFFDFRPLYGDVTLADKLRSWLAAYAAEHNRFLLLMAQNALQNQPPLGVLRDFILTGGGDDYPHTLDLKVNGITPFVDAARIYALAAGVTATNTLERLQEAGARLRFASADVDAWAQAFQYIQNLRLRHQALRLAAGQTPNNHLDPDSLNELDRRILKEALRQARNLQGRLGRDFGGAGVGFGA